MFLNKKKKIRSSFFLVKHFTALLGNAGRIAAISIESGIDKQSSNFHLLYALGKALNPFYLATSYGLNREDWALEI